MPRTEPSCLRAPLLTLGLLAMAAGAAAQEGPGPPADPVYVADARTLDRVREALAREPIVALSTSGRRFFLEIVERERTWQDYLAGSHGMFAITSITPPRDRPGGAALGGGAGVDLLGIFRSVGRAMREREARQIRAQIDRELRALDAARDTAP